MFIKSFSGIRHGVAAAALFVAWTAAAYGQMAAGVASATEAAHPNAAGPQAVGPKKPGVIRIGIVMPKYEMGSPAGAGAAEAVRNAEKQMLAGPKMETVTITSLLPIQVSAEAKELECDYVLNSSVSQKVKQSSGFGGLKTFASLAPISSMAPRIGAAAGVAGMVAANAAQNAAVEALSTTVKARGEVTFEYTLVSGSGSVTVHNTQKAKAKSDGEDVITPMIQQGATEIVTQVSK
jgi:hypothetical protein